MKKFIIPTVMFFSLGVSPVYAQQKPEKKTNNKQVEKPVTIAEPEPERSPDAVRIESKENVEYRRERSDRNQQRKAKILRNEQSEYGEEKRQE
jgi:hypothetical protein